MNIIHIPYIDKYLNNYNKSIYKTTKFISFTPGSKSITNRILLLFKLNKLYILKITNMLISEDTLTMINYLKLYNINIYIYNNIFILYKNIKNTLKVYNKLFLNNAGTVVRPLIALYLINNNDKIILIDGSNRMRKRPLEQLFISINKLKMIKNKVIYLKYRYYLPIKIINNNTINNNSYIIIENNISSQYISSILLCLTKLTNKLLIIKFTNISSYIYIYMTVKIMNLFNINIKIINNYIIYKGINLINIPKILYIEGDYSSSSYNIIKLVNYIDKIGLISNISPYSLQGDKAILNIFKYINIKFKYTKNKLIIFKSKAINIFSISIDILNIPDLALTLTQLLYNNIINIIKFYNTKTWSFKESNRTKSLSKELKKFKYKLINGKNWFIIFIYKKIIINNLLINTYEDHRIAMTISLSAIKYNINIINPNTIKKTYPNYFNE